MSAGTLALAAAVDLAIAGTLVYVGLRIQRRDPAAASRRASVLFALWWYGLAFTVLTNALREGVAAAGLGASPAFAAATMHLYVVALVASVWGILFYLVVLFTGSRRSFWPLTAFYGAYLAVALWLVARMEPTGFSPGKWFVQVAYAQPLAGGPFLTLMVLLLLLPQIGAAVAYGSLWFRLERGPARRRVGIVSSALVVWLGSALLAPFLQLGRFEWWQAGGRFVGLAAALAILYAYLATTPGPAPGPRGRRASPELLARVRELV